MRFYWSLRSIPELAQLPANERGRAWREASREAMRTTSVKAALILVGVLAGLGTMLFGIVGAAIGGGIGGLIFGQLATDRARPHLKAFAERQRRGQQGSSELSS
jgi:hypothetical protein